MNAFKNKRREILQLMLLAVALLLPWFIDFSAIVSNAIRDGAEVELDYYLALTSGKLVSGAILAGAVLHWIRKLNANVVFNEVGNLYYGHGVIWCKLCHCLLGYKKCSLVRVPISMQYKLIINQVFKEFSYGNDSNYIHLEDEKIKETTEIGKNDKVNIVLADTYHISNDLLPKTVNEYKTIFIERDHAGDGNKYISDSFCYEIQKIVQQLIESGTNTVNIFPATNPAHNIRIVQSSFMKGGRGDIEHIYVFPQSNSSTGDWRFSDKGVKIR